MSSAINEPVFFLDSYTTANTIFSGHCFSAIDFIFGQSGHDEYQYTSGQPIASGLDGCYVIATRTNDNWHLGSDFYGYKKLFYYWDNDYYAVSNSLWELSKILKQKNKLLSPNYAQISVAAQPSGSVFDQPFCSKTIIQEICLLPSWSDLIIGPDRFKLIPKTAGPKLIDTSRSYSDALRIFIDTWVNRFVTLLDDPRIHISCNLSAGLDSRTSFSILHKSIMISNPDFRSRLHINCHPHLRNNIIETDIAQPTTVRYFSCPTHAKP